MAGKPKKSEYKPSQAEKIEAGVSLAQYNRYRENYKGVLAGWITDSKKDFTEQLRGRAGADVAQATDSFGIGDNYSKLNLVENSYLGADRASLATKAMLEGSLQGREVQANLQTNVLAAGQKQASKTQLGLSQLSKIGASDVIAQAANKQLVRGARGGMLGAWAGAFIGQGIKNKRANLTWMGDTPSAGGYTNPLMTPGDI